MFKYFVFCSCLIGFSPAGWALSYGDLLPGIIDKLPKKNQSDAYQLLAHANQGYADSWIAGEVDVSLRHENANIIGNQSDRIWEVGASFPTWKPGQTKSLSQLGDSYQTLTVLSRQTLKLSASAKLRQLVWAYKKAQTQLAFAQQSLAQTQSLVKFVSQKVRAGESPKFDLLVAQKSVMQYQQILAQHQASLRVAQQNFQRWTGQTQLPEPLAEKLMSSRSTHPDSEYYQALIAIENAKLRWVEGQKSANPSVFIGSRMESSDGAASADKQFLIAEISVPLGFDPASKTRKSEQQQQVSDATIRQREIDQQLQLYLLSAKQQLKATERIEDLAQQQFTLSEEAMLLAESAYQQGETTIQALLLAKKQFFEDQLNNQLAKLNHLEAIANLNQSQGVILE